MDEPKIESTAAVTAAPAEPVAAAEQVSAAPIITPPVSEPAPDAPVETAGIQWQALVAGKMSALASSRVALAAACIVIAGGVGVGAGALGATGLAHSSGAPRSLASSELHGLADTIAQMKADVAALRATSDQLNRATTAQFAKLSDRLEHIDHAQADPAAKLAKVAETVDRLDQRTAQFVAAKETTSAITPPAKPTVTAAASVPEPPRPAILDEWRLRNVYDGGALIQGRMGVIDVAPGDILPGGGRVEGIRRQDGRWVVVTSKGLIVSMR